MTLKRGNKLTKQVLYRKYRSRKLSEVVGQQHITDTLESALSNNLQAHAYLFVGPRGVGKTSVARIFAFDVNSMPYQDSGHIDIIEIDAASNRRIDEIRDLRDKIHISPVEANYKVYIIDEVHMLTREAFNALLKTLEEPPAHAIFILATTEAHKVPETITSRTQRYIFRPIAAEAMLDHLKKIAKQEKIKVDDEALLAIARYSRGSFRDSISLLDQLSTLKKNVDLKLVEKFLGFGSQSLLKQLMQAVNSGNTADVDSLLGDMLLDGTQPTTLALQIVDYLRDEPVNEVSLDLIDNLLKVSLSLQPQISLENALLRAALAVTPTPAVDIPMAQPVVPKVEKPKAKPKVTKKVVKEPEQPSPTVSDNDDEKLETLSLDHWTKILENVKQANYTLYAVLRMAEVRANESKLELRFVFDFHTRRFEDKKLVSMLREAAADIRPKPPEILVITDKEATPLASDDIDTIDIDVGINDRPNNGHVDAVLETFGGGEVVEL